MAEKISEFTCLVRDMCEASELGTVLYTEVALWNPNC